MRKRAAEAATFFNRRMPPCRKELIPLYGMVKFAPQPGVAEAQVTLGRGFG
jgi:hypothetical protein